MFLALTRLTFYDPPVNYNLLLYSGEFTVHLTPIFPNWEGFLWKFLSSFGRLPYPGGCHMGGVFGILESNELGPAYVEEGRLCNLMWQLLLFFKNDPFLQTSNEAAGDPKQLHLCVVPHILPWRPACLWERCRGLEQGWPMLIHIVVWSWIFFLLQNEHPVFLGKNFCSLDPMKMTLMMAVISPKCMLTLCICCRTTTTPCLLFWKNPVIFWVITVSPVPGPGRQLRCRGHPGHLLTCPGARRWAPVSLWLPCLQWTCALPQISVQNTFSWAFSCGRF